MTGNRTSKSYSNQRASLSAVAVGPDYGALTSMPAGSTTKRWPTSDFIKVDVEGYEFQMLQGAAEAITRDRPVLLVEIEERHTKMTLVDAVGRIESSFVYRAYFYPHGCLAPFAALHPVANHSVSASRNDYVSNFIFFPEELPESDFNLGLRRLLGA